MGKHELQPYQIAMLDFIESVPEGAEIRSMPCPGFRMMGIAVKKDGTAYRYLGKKEWKRLN